MRTRCLQRFLLVVACLAAGAAGCSGRELPETVPVTGTILHEGKPVAHAAVGFVPKREGAGAFPARGQTDESGAFTLQTYFGPDHDIAGATPGEYIVTVEKRDVPPDPAEMARQFARNPGMVAKNLLPEEYMNAAKSPLSATVTRDGDNSFKFELME